MGSRDHLVYSLLKRDHLCITLTLETTRLLVPKRSSSLFDFCHPIWSLDYAFYSLFSSVNGIRFTIALSTIGFHHTYTQFFSSSLSLPPFLLHNLFLAPAVLESHTEASFCVFVLYFTLVHLPLVLIVLFFFSILILLSNLILPVLSSFLGHLQLPVFPTQFSTFVR